MNPAPPSPYDGALKHADVLEELCSEMASRGYMVASGKVRAAAAFLRNLSTPSATAPISRATCTICAAPPGSDGFYTGCMYEDEGRKPINGWHCDGHGNLSSVPEAPRAVAECSTDGCSEEALWCTKHAVAARVALAPTEAEIIERCAKVCEDFAAAVPAPVQNDAVAIGLNDMGLEAIRQCAKVIRSMNAGGKS